VIEILVRAIAEAQYSVHRVVEEASDARTPNTGSFSFQIEYLAYHAGFPEQPRVKPWTVACQRCFVLCNHPETETPIASDVLETRNLPSGLLGISFD
tara:strand:- start:105 stop:395 length:291 start_codon:yes stop_codon:yes gene_type:complete